MRNGLSPTSSSPMRNGSSPSSLSSSQLSVSPPHYSKSNDKIASSTRSKLWWYTLTSLAVMAVVILTGNQSMVEEAKNSGDHDELGFVSNKRPIKQISILGERNSGTRWTFAHLSTCFNHTLTVKRSLTRYKHWFQHRNSTRYSKDTLVVAQFRNPYDWIEAMRKVPHHAPAHIDLEWKEFVTKTWTTERFGADLNITDKENFICQEKFRYKDIVSCLINPLPKTSYKHKLRYSENQPFYEMRNDGSGLPYNNILELRADKIRNFVQQVKKFNGVRDVWLTQYEYLLARGTKQMLDKISAITGVPYKCDPYPVQNRRRRKLQPDFVEYLTENMDWEAEALVGYYPEAKKNDEEESAKEE